MSCILPLFFNILWETCKNCVVNFLNVKTSESIWKGTMACIMNHHTNNFIKILHGCMLTCFCHVGLWHPACHASLFMEFYKQEYWNGLPCPYPGDLPDPGIKPTSLCLLHWQAGSLPLAPSGKPFGRLHTGKCLRGSLSTLDSGGECREPFLSFEEEIERILVKMLEGP